MDTRKPSIFVFGSDTQPCAGMSPAQIQAVYGHLYPEITSPRASPRLINDDTLTFVTEYGQKGVG